MEARPARSRRDRSASGDEWISIKKERALYPPLLHIAFLFDTNHFANLMRQVEPMVGQTFVA